MNIKQQEYWKKTRKIGKKLYILKPGVLYWGITTALLSSIAMYFLHPQENWIIRTLFNLVIFPIGGIFVGKLSWNENEKKLNH